MIVAAAFYGFWLVWRVLLPILPGSSDLEDNFSPFGRRFTDPLIVHIARLLHLPERLIATVWLVLVAALITALNALSASLNGS